MKETTFKILSGKTNPQLQLCLKLPQLGLLRVKNEDIHPAEFQKNTTYLFPNASYLVFLKLGRHDSISIKR